MRDVSLVRVLADLFPGRERLRVAGAFCMSTLAAFSEVVGVAAILPFMAIVMDPSTIDRYPGLRSLVGKMGAHSTGAAIFFLGVGAVIIVALGNVASAANVLVQERFAARTKARLSVALFNGYLQQPFEFHTHRDAPSLLKVAVTDTVTVMGGIISPILLSASRALMALGILLLLFIHDPLLAFIVAVFLGTSYGTVYYVIRHRERRIAIDSDRFTLDRQRVSQEGLGGVKELQVLGRERHAMDQFARACVGAARTEAASRIAGLLPRHVMEAVAFGGILLMTLALFTKSGGSARTIIPILALYAFAGYRLLPALQQVFAAAISVRFYLPALRGIHADFIQVVRPLPEVDIGRAPELPDIHFRKEIRLERVAFSYSQSPRRALNDISLVVRPRESIGFVGRTGAGKTTLADLILGLYQPSSGIVSIDGVPLRGAAVRAWRERVGYVPQLVFLANASVAENIAYGLPPDAIDHAAVRKAAMLAQAEEFINALARGFDTLVGERGVKLSGGQRQRIGIARALYHEPEVLVFDEATSALDGLTEDAVMEAVRELRSGRTVLLIAHRLRTVEVCDRIVLLEAGTIIAEGSYQELLERSEEFRRLVGKRNTNRASDVQA